jgi:hypothetical protein
MGKQSKHDKESTDKAKGGEPTAETAGEEKAPTAVETVVNEPQTAAGAAHREGDGHGSAPEPGAEVAGDGVAGPVVADAGGADTVPPGGPVQRQGDPGVPLPSPTLRKGDLQTPLRPDALAPGDPGEVPPKPKPPSTRPVGGPLKFVPQDQLRSRALSLRAEIAKAAAEDQRSLEVQWGKETEEPTIAVQILPRVKSGEDLAKIIEEVAGKAGMSLRDRRQIGRSELLVFNVHAV